MEDGVLLVLVTERPAISEINFSGNKSIETEQLEERLKGRSQQRLLLLPVILASYWSMICWIPIRAANISGLAHLLQRTWLVRFKLPVWKQSFEARENRLYYY